MAKLQVDSSFNKDHTSVRDSIIENHGLSQSTTGELIKIIKDNSEFYRKEIRDKSVHVKTMQQSLIEKNDIIKALIKELTVAHKHNEDVKSSLVDKVEKIFELIQKTEP